MLFTIDPNAAQYIHRRTGAVVIRLNFEPSGGGCPCTPARLVGTFMPVLSLGRPAPEDAEQFQSQLAEQVEVFFPPGLGLEYGRTHIRIKLRGGLWFRWLELEGAMGRACIQP